MNTFSRHSAVVVAAGVLSIAFAASADAPKLAPASSSAFTRSKAKIASRPAAKLALADRDAVRGAFAKALKQYAKDGNAKRFVASGGEQGLSGDAAAAYQMVASRALSSAPVRKKLGTGPGWTAQMIPATYAIEAAEVTAATMTPPCGGDISLSFTVKNLGVAVPSSASPRLVVDLARAVGQSGEHASAWVNLPSLPNGGTATVTVPPLAHRRSSNSTCSSGLITVTPTFVDVSPKAGYRLTIDLTASGADATLASGIFLSPNAGSNGGDEGGLSLDFGDGLDIPGLDFPGGGGSSCPFGLVKCASGVCAASCPPCGANMKECYGGCLPASYPCP